MNVSKLSIIAFTRNGCLLGEKIKKKIKEDNLNNKWESALFTTKVEITEDRKGLIMPINGTLSDWCEQQFEEADAILFIGACGIAVRTIAPHLKGKCSDPAVIVADEKGEYVISLLSGHIGGANELTVSLSEVINAKPVITTASDVNDIISVDVFARQNDLYITNFEQVKRFAVMLLDGEKIELSCEGKISGQLPKEFVYISTINKGGIVISPFIPKTNPNETLHLVPRSAVVGLGCKKGVREEEIEHFILTILEKLNLSIHSLECVVTIDLKKEEAGIINFCKKYGLPLLFYTAGELMEAQGEFTSSSFVKKITGVENVCERAVMRYSPDGELLQQKLKKDGMTIAVGLKKWGIKFG